MEREPLSRLVFGRVMHQRLSPVDNHFVYPVFYLLLNLDEMDDLQNWCFGVNSRRIFSFYDADHGDGRAPRSWVKDILHDHGISDCDENIWVQTFPRVMGYVFNPVSFWFCERSDGEVGAIIAEVNNTFSDRHCYVLTPDPCSGQFRSVVAPKQMHVSPFYPTEGEYRFDFNTRLDKPYARINYYHSDELQLVTAIHGRSTAMTTKNLLLALCKQPLMTIVVMARIHWQALRLWVKGVRIHKRLAVKEIR